MSIIVRSTIGGFVAIVFSGCGSEATAPAGQVMLSSLQFARSEVQAGKPLILLARPAAGGETVAPVPVVVRASSGAEQQVFVGPWRSLSDTDIAAVLADNDGRAFVGFKEADASRGVDELGQNLTSQETFDRMKQWLREQGVAITREFLLPHVSATIEANTELVSRIRGHENVDYLEPILPGWRNAVDSPAVGGDWAAIVQTDSGSGRAFSVRSGDAVTAIYRQPDGTLLTATVLVRQ